MAPGPNQELDSDHTCSGEKPAVLGDAVWQLFTEAVSFGCSMLGFHTGNSLNQAGDTRTSSCLLVGHHPPLHTDHSILQD